MKQNISQCRVCDSQQLEFTQFGRLPISNKFRGKHEAYNHTFEASLAFCKKCEVLQISNNLKSDDLFGCSYPYLSSVSTEYKKSWEEEINDFLEVRAGLEIASNDGVLFPLLKMKHQLLVGVEPSFIPFQQSKKYGVPVINDFFSTELANEIVRKYGKFDRIIANNVLAHVPDINDFIHGIAIALNDGGQVYIDVSDTEAVLKDRLFDLVYLEHIFYWTAASLRSAFERYGLNLLSIKKIPLHGGSIRCVFGKLANEKYDSSNDLENPFSITTAMIKNLAKEARSVATAIECFLHESNGKVIVGFGAAAKAVTLLSFIASSSKAKIEFFVDGSKAKQSLLFPCDEIKIEDPAQLLGDYNLPNTVVLVFAWNYFDEISDWLASNSFKGEIINVKHLAESVL